MIIEALCSIAKILYPLPFQCEKKKKEAHIKLDPLRLIKEEKYKYTQLH